MARGQILCFNAKDLKLSSSAYFPQFFLVFTSKSQVLGWSRDRLLQQQQKQQQQQHVLLF